MENKRWSTTEEEINRAIIQYCNNYFYPYALMLDGAWGSGKSYFVRNKIIGCWPKDMEITPIYISLYGLGTVSDFLDKIYISMFEKKAGRYFAYTLRFIKNVGVGVVLSKYGLDFLEKSIKDGQDFFKNKILDMEKYCFIFDDFERCMIPMNEILGEISGMIEEHNAKVLIVANESEIGFYNMQYNVELKTIAAALTYQQVKEIDSKDKKKDSTEQIKDNINILKEVFFGAENSLYKKTKEKIIGQTLYYNPTIAEKVESVFENMTMWKLAEQEMFSEDFIEWIIEQRAFIVRLMEHLECRNLRTLEFAVSRFMELEQCIQWPSYDKKYVNALREHILYSALYISVQIREKPTQRRNWQADEVYVFHTMYPETTIFGEFSSYVRLKFVEDYICDGCVDPENIHKGLERAAALLINRDRKKDDPLNSLLQYLNLDDHDIMSLLDSIKKNLKNGAYGLGDYRSILALCQELSKIGYKEASITSWALFIKENLEKGNISEDVVGAVIHIQDREEPPYKKCLEEIENYEFAQDNQPVEKKITDILKNNHPVDELKHLIQEDARGFFSHGLFIKFLVNDLAEYLIRRPNREIYQFYQIVRHYYYPKNIKDFYQQDVGPLNEFAGILKGKEGGISDRMEKHLIEMLCNLIQDVCGKMA